MNVDELVGQNFPVILTPLDRAPSKESVSKWLESRSVSKATMEETPSQKKCKKKQDNVQQNVQHRSQLEAPSMNNSYGFRVSFGNCLEAKSVHQVIDFLHFYFYFIKSDFIVRLIYIFFIL